MSAIRVILGVMLIVGCGLACAQVAISPKSRFKVTERFPDRLGQVEVLGVEVRSALPDGMVSDADLERLAAFLASELQATTIGVVVNLNAHEMAREMTVILTVDIHLLKAATLEERRNRTPSHLQGTISLQRVATGKNLGTASIWSKGSNLKLESNNAPDTVREFASVIRRIVQ